MAHCALSRAPVCLSDSDLGFGFFHGLAFSFTICNGCRSLRDHCNDARGVVAQYVRWATDVKYTLHHPK